MKDDNGRPCVQYVAMSVDKDLNLNIYTNRGCPTKAKKLQTSAETKRDLTKLKKEMKYNDGTELLLAISITTYGMNRHVNVFSEVFYLDVTANTNKQKRDIFLMVVNQERPPQRTKGEFPRLTGLMLLRAVRA